MNWTGVIPALTTNFRADGSIDHAYPVPCYSQAIANLKDDQRLYSSAEDDIRRALQRAIAALPEYHRAVILLREVEGMAYEEIAKVLGCSVGTVMSRLHYARGKLKEALKSHRAG